MAKKKMSNNANSCKKCMNNEVNANDCNSNSRSNNSMNKSNLNKSNQ